MIGWLETTADIPAGAVIYYDQDNNALTIFDADTGRTYVWATPFVIPGLDPHELARLLHF